MRHPHPHLTPPHRLLRPSTGPLDAAECDPLSASIEERLAAGEINRSEQNFTDTASGTSGVACWLWIERSGEDYGDFVFVAETIAAVLTEQGWTEDAGLVADSPTSLASGYRKDGTIALVHSAAFLPADVDCDGSQPLSECFEEVEPAAQRIEASVLFAEPAE